MLQLFVGHRSDVECLQLFCSSMPCPLIIYSNALLIVVCSGTAANLAFSMSSLVVGFAKQVGSLVVGLAKQAGLLA